MRSGRKPRPSWRLICGYAILVLLSAEAALRLKHSSIKAGLEHPHFHHRLKPLTAYTYGGDEFSVTIHTNRYGLRGPDPVLPKPAGTFRILMLGDSFTFGFPVKEEEAFVSLIEQGLKSRGYPVDVVNGGVSGYSPTLEYVSLRDEYLAFDPDLVVLWYDLGDLQEDYWYQKNLLYDERGRIIRCDSRYINGRFNWGEWLRTHVAVVKYFDDRVLRTIEKARILGVWGYLQVRLRGERAKVAIAKLKAAKGDADTASSDRFLLARGSMTLEQLRSSWGQSERYLLMIRDLLAEREIPLVVGAYPYGILVGPDQWAEGRTYWGFEKGKTYDSAPVRSILGDFAAREGIPLIDSYESFRRAAPSGKLFYDWDGHLNPQGHRVLAEHVLRDASFDALLRQQLERRRP
jgi:lysophospholipase L1-like esterase